MPLTKVTPRKPGFLCSICLLRLPTKEEWNKYLLNCGIADINKRKFECDHCDQAFSKKIVLIRHVKRLHPSQEMTEKNESSKKQSCEKSQSRQVEDEDDWQEDPGELLFEEVDLEAGRTHRKKTSPVLPGLKRRSPSASETMTKDFLTIEEVVKPCDTVSDIQKAPLDDQHCLSCKRKAKKVDAETQTEAVVKAGKSHQKTIRVTRKFHKDGEMVEHWEEDIWND